MRADLQTVPLRSAPTTIGSTTVVNMAYLNFVNAHWKATFCGGLVVECQRCHLEISILKHVSAYQYHVDEY